MLFSVWGLLSTTTTRNDSFNYYFQKQPHGDRLKAEMSRTVKKNPRRIMSIIRKHLIKNESNFMFVCAMLWIKQRVINGISNCRLLILLNQNEHIN